MTPRITAAGMYDISAATYHADPVPGGSLSSSGARKLLPPSCPAIFDHERRHGQQHRNVFDLGHAFHSDVLGVGAPVVVIDADNYNTKAARAERDTAYADGKVPLLVPERAQVDAMTAAVRGHHITGPLFDLGRGLLPERSLFWRDDEFKVWRRAMLDGILLPETTGDRLIVVDVKSCASAEPSAISKSMAKYGYYQQAPWYLDGCIACQLTGPQEPRFVFVFVEKNPPHVITVVEPKDDDLTWGRIRNRKALDVYRRCTEAGRWPGYADDVVTIGIPSWAEYQHQAAYDAGHYDITEEVA